MISRIFRIVKTFFLEGLDEMEYYYGYKGGEKIKKLRKEAGMTQAELASKQGLKDSVIAKYENGRKKKMCIYRTDTSLIPKMVREIEKYDPMKDLEK